MLEIVCCSAEDCKIAGASGADRIELCAALELGGLTPSLGMIEESLAVCNIPIVVMIRPRAGGFFYTESEFTACLRDAQHALEAGAAGIVFGFLTESGELDAVRTKAMIQLADGKETVMHGAFDVIFDQLAAMDTLIELGLTRILTSGGAPTAMEGAERLRNLHKNARGQIQLLPRGGLTASDIPAFHAVTDFTDFHLAPFEFVNEPSCRANPALDFSGVAPAPNHARPRTDAAAVLEALSLAQSALKPGV